MRLVTRWTAICTLLLWVAMCGQKGPLYLPEKNNTGFAPQIPVL